MLPFEKSVVLVIIIIIYIIKGICVFVCVCVCLSVPQNMWVDVRVSVCRSEQGERTCVCECRGEQGKCVHACV